MDPFSGTWAANIAKSQRDPNHQFQSATLRFVVYGDAVSLTHTGVNMSGKEESGTTHLNADGTPRPVSPHAPGVMVTTRWVGSHVLETAAMKDGELVGHGRYEVSGDGQTLTAKVSGTDGSGKPFSQVIVFDREDAR
jgi:hypothetical protein